MRRLSSLLLLLAACAASHEPGGGGPGALVACMTDGRCETGERCLARSDVDGGTFCTPMLGRACADDSECTAIYACTGATPSTPHGTCGPPSTTPVPCTLDAPPHHGDACAPLATGYTCHVGRCTESGTTCWCGSGVWHCGYEIRESFADSGTGIPVPPSPCGSPPLCWTLCGARPP